MAINFVEQIDDAVRVQNVLVSVSDKAGLEALIPELVQINPSLKLYSTGGTFQALRTCLGESLSKKHLVQVADYTGQPEMQGGLVKTLDFKIYLGLLSETYNPAHAEDLKRVQGTAIDMVIVNLYPFAQTIAKRGVTPEQARANIDIGGPCMVRAAAKNFLRVASVTDPANYLKIVAELKATGGKLSLKTRFDLARKAFAHTAAYDTAIAAYFAKCPFTAVQKTYRTINP